MDTTVTLYTGHRALDHAPNYQEALEIARSDHPSVVLANTNGYRFGRFEEHPYGDVTVTMMGSHIATFTPEGVRVWSRGYRTVTTSEALSQLVQVAWFYNDGGVMMFASYAVPTSRSFLEEGQLFPYKS